MTEQTQKTLSTQAKPLYIVELEQEILALTPDEAIRVQAFVDALISQRTTDGAV